MSTEPIAEIRDSYEAQVRTWRAQRVGWCVLAVIVVAAVLGGFGPGVLGTVTELDSTGLRVQYDRFVRYEAPNTLHIELPASSANEQEFLLDARWLHEVHLETVQPEPTRVRSEGEHVRYTISVQRRGSPTHVSLHFEPEAPGTLTGSVALEAGAPLRISQFVYP